MKKFGFLLTVFAFYFGGAVAVAVPLEIDPFICSDGKGINGISVTDVIGFSGGASQCFGTFDGNDPGPSADGLETGTMIFDFISKVDVNDTNGSLTTGGVDIGLTITGTSGSLPDDSGAWSYDGTLFSAEAFIIVIKAANSPGWAAWLFEGTHAASDAGTWLVAWVANGGACFQSTATASDLNCADISHLSIYAKNGTTVPEPATAALLGLGLIGFGLARRRKIK